MRNTYFLIAIAIGLTASCTNNTSPNSGMYTEPKTQSNSATHLTDSNYMRTGLYFLAANEANGRKMECQKTFYYLEKTPCVSVDNVTKAEIVKTELEGTTYQDIKLTFDAKGTQDLIDATSNIMHSKIAMVVAGRLLWVPTIGSAIRGGSLSISMNGYSEQELQEMIHAIDKKL